MSSKQVPILSLILFFSAATLHAQPNIPVDQLTGRAQVSIPIWQVSSGRLSAPVSLYYNSSGVKTTDNEGNAGMGWNLAAAGSLSREVRGLPDDYNGNVNDASDTRRGWLVSVSGTRVAQTINSFSPASDDNLSNCTDETADFNFILGLANSKDPEPDIFSFNAPGLSGQFVFGVDGLPKPVPYQDIKITVTGLPISSVEITKNDGIKYTFNTSESIIRRAVPMKASNIKPVTQFTTQREIFKHYTSFTGNWRLAKIEAPSGENIQFGYGDLKTVGSRSYLAISSVSSPAPDTTYYLNDQLNVFRLKWVQSASQRVDFTWNGGDQLITAAISDRVTGTMKKFSFTYKDVWNTNSANGYGARSFLKEIREQNVGCNSFPSYSFDYYDINFTTNNTSIPFHDPKIKQDIWGYFNDWATNNSPTVYYFNSKTGTDRYRFYSIPGLGATAAISGANHAVNPATVMYGSLKMINYPTGGQAEIIYEPNDYHDVEADATNYGSGLRVQQIITRDQVGNSPNASVSYEYKTSDNKSSGKWIYRSVFGYHDVDNFYATNRDNSSEPTILYERVKVRQTGKGWTISEYLLPGMDPNSSYTVGSPYEDWTAARVRIASCDAIGQLGFGYYQNPFAPNVNYDFERGLISKISSFNEAGQQIHEKNYAYQRLASPSVIVKGLRYEFLKNISNLGAGTSSSYRNIYAFSHYAVLANAGKVMLTETERVADMNDVTKFYETASTYTFSNTHYLLSYLTSQNSDGKTYKTKFKYAKDFANLTQPSGADVYAAPIKKLNDDFMHGSIVETVSSVIDGTETITSANLTLYGTFPDSLNTISRVLPVENRTTTSTGGFSEASVNPSSGSNQTFQFASSLYTPVSKVEQFDYIGNPVTVRSKQKNLSGVHMGYKKSLPVATISNAAANESMYAGFETYTGFEFDVVPGGLTYPLGWSGRKGLQMNAGTVLEKTTITKSTQTKTYRYSLWVYGTAATTLTFRVFEGATQRNTAAIVYGSTDLNKWKFFEGRIDITSVAGASFKLKLESTAVTTIDDAAFYPESASMSTFTYESLYGKTSEADARGINTFYEYDDLGRLKYIKDQDKNLRQNTDYYYKVQPYPALNTSFTASHAPYQVVNGTTVTYTAPANCNTVINDWYVNGVKLGNNVTTFQYLFNVVQKYTIKLVVTDLTLGSSSFQQEYDVKNIGVGAVTVSVTSSNYAYAFCDNGHSKTFTANFGGCYVEEDLEINWYYDIGSGWVLMNSLAGTPQGTLSNNNKTLVFDPIIAFNGIGNLAAYAIKCEGRTVCPTDGILSLGSFTRNISYNGSTQCL